MTRTTTVDPDALVNLFARYGLGSGGLLEERGQLVAEPSNQADPNAVAIHVLGARIG